MISNQRDKANGINGDERAVSPVVGVALLIAITVILAAVIGFVVLDTTDAQNAASTDARMDFSGTTSSGLTIAHAGGDAINKSNLVVKRNGTTLTGYTISGSGDFSTGETIEIDKSNVAANDRFVVVYDDPNSNRETQIATYEVS